jgi:putative intracellular protease/amidase
VNKNKLYVIAGALIALGLLVRLGLPPLLNGLGLHAHYDIPSMDLSGKRALIITTSHDTLGDTGKATGVMASEMTVPYYAFSDAGMTVDVASIEGGAIPIEPGSLGWPLATEEDERYLADPIFQSKVERSYEISAVDIDGYDIVFLAGGWGAAYDFGQSATLGDKMSEAYANQAVIGGVCHGPLGLLQARAPDGSPLVEGRRISAVTDKQIEELGITHTPMHPERDLRAAGVDFEAESGFRDLFATHVVVDDRIVTGQNQNSGGETAHRMMETLLAQESANP